MGTFRKLSWATAILAFIIYRNGRVARNSIFVKSPLPDGYYAQGNFTTDCVNLPNPPSANADTDQSGSDPFRFCEDGTFWDLHDKNSKFEERRVLFSCDAGRKEWNTVMGPLRSPNPLGSLWLYAPKYTKENVGAIDPRKVEAQRIKLKGYPDGHDFHPLGMGIWPSYGGNGSHLYVINHARHGTVIEQFTLHPTGPIATHIRTISSPYFISPNAVALTSPDSFYVTNDHLITRRWPVIGHVLPLIESVLALPLAFVAHVALNPPSSPNAIASHELVELFVPFPNGIAVSHTGEQVALVSTTQNLVTIYSRDPQSQQLKSKLAMIEVPFTPDNIHYYGEDGSLILAGHPSFPQLAKVAGNVQPVAPSWVVSISPRESKLDSAPAQDEDAEAAVSVYTKVLPHSAYTIKTIFQSNGVGFSSSSTGLYDTHSGALYVTGLYADPGVIVCRPSL